MDPCQTYKKRPSYLYQKIIFLYNEFHQNEQTWIY